MTESLLISTEVLPEVLVVDDNFSNILLVEGILDSLPLKIDRAFSGLEAIEKIEKKEYALLLLDVQMPGMDGFKAAEIIREDGKNALLPIIFISAIYNHNYYYQKGLETGAVDFITKPIVPKVFTSKVKVFLELYLHRKSLEREIQERKKAEERRLKLSNFLNRIASGLIKADHQQIDQYINDLFNWVGNNFDLSFISSYKFRPAQNDFEVLNHWSPDQKQKSNFAIEIPRTEAIYSQLINLKRQDHLIFEKEPEGINLVPNQEYDSLLLFPLFENQDKSGFLLLGRKNLNNSIEDYEIQMLELMSEMLAHAYSRKDMELKLRKALENAQQSDKLKSAFLANISYEIRTPMNAIMGFSGLLSSDQINEAEKQKFLNYISKNASSLLQLINDILEISRIETGQINIKSQGIDLNLLMTQVDADAKNLQKETQKNQLRLKLSTFETNDHFTFISDENRIRQVFGYLLSNAFKFTDQGQVEYGISGIEENSLCFYVADTGIGVDIKHQETIFDVFRQADESDTRSFGGSGLGLSIARSFVNLMGGKIWVESEREKGSAFYFSLPITVEKRTSIHNNEHPDLNGSTILVAEDTEANYDLLAAYLETSGAKTIWVKNGQEALNLMRWNKNIDLIIMDVKMPVMDGLEATREIRKLNHEIPVIALTAFYTKNESDEVRRAGCNEFLSKPVKQKQLFQMVQKYLQKVPL